MTNAWTIRFSVVLLGAILFVLPVRLTAKNSSLYQRSVDAVRQRQSRAASDQSDGQSSMSRDDDRQASAALGVSVRAASWTMTAEPDPKAYRVHDLITIVIHEVSKNATSADASTERESTLDLKIEEWLQLTRGGLFTGDTATHGQPELKFSAERDFDGKGDVSRSDSLTARIKAQVIDVMPNGNLLLEAIKEVTTDDEVTRITLTGVCRSQDVGIDNSVLSSDLHDLNVVKKHKGMARAATRQSLLEALLNWLNPF